MLIKLGNLLVWQEKRYMNTDAGERFPVKIAFNRRLNEEEMIHLAAYALLIESKNVEKETIKE